MDPENPAVMREAALGYEFVKQREKTLELLRNAPIQLLQELNHQPDVKDCSRTRGFNNCCRNRKRGNTMSDHTVTLNYANNGFTASPSKIAVKPGHTIHFKLGTGPANGKVRVTFKDPQFFSAARFNSGDPDIRVTGNPTPTTYHCELLVNGETVAQSSENAGGDVVPETN